jgi:hypothetical protein
VSEEIKNARIIGFIAQEVKKTNPHCISEWDKKTDYDEDKTEEDTKRYGICYNDYVVHLVGAVQEVVKQLEVQKERVQVLEERVQVLEERVQVLEEREKVWVQHAKEQEDKVKRLEANIEKLASLVAQLIQK